MFLILVAVSCGSDDEATPDDGSNNGGTPTTRSYDEALAEYDDLLEILKGLTQSPGLTRQKTFPTSGTATYKGVHEGTFRAETTTSNTHIAYVANVEFTVDFATGAHTGKMFNFSTDLAGFENPEGTLKIAGSVRDTQDLGGDEFGLRFQITDGKLTQGERTASFDGATSDKGRFYGLAAEYIAIGVTSTFKWTAGPDAGTTSGTRGSMYADVD